MADSPVRPRLDEASYSLLWLFAATTILSIALQSIFFFSAMALLVLATFQSGSWQRLQPIKLWVWALPFLGLALVASVLSENQTHSLETWRKWLLISALLWVPALANDGRRLRGLLGALLAFSALWALGSSLLALSGPLKAWLSGEAVVSILGRWPNVGEWRAISGSGGYMVMGTGCMLLLVLFTSLAIEDKTWRRPLPLLCMATLALALLLTQTRGAWLGAALGVAFLFVMRQRRWLWVLGALALALLAWPQSPVRERLAQSMDMSQDSTRERVYMAQAGLAIAKAHPWFGVGDAMETWQGSDGEKAGYYRRFLPEGAKVWHTTRDQEHGHLHNNLIQVAAMYGVPALIALLALFGRILAEAWGRRRSASALTRGLAFGALAISLAWWTNGMVEFNFGSFQSSFTLWFLLGLALA